MELIFGVTCDGRVYPDFPGEREGVVGSAVVGPAGLIDILELQLGLTGPTGPEAVRIAAYVAKVRASLADDPNRFFAASFKSDPWTTARYLLDWRDQLLAAGWSRKPCGAIRPDALAQIEFEEPRLPAGLGDRLFEVISALQSKPRLDISWVALVEDRHLLPPGWRRLIDAVERCGVDIRGRAVPPSATPGSDLLKAQEFLGGNGASALTGDGSLVTVEADTALLASEALAEWLGAGSEEQLCGTVVLSPDGDTSLLDRALQARGLPALGQSAGSPWRGALQVLPLAFAVAWKPFNARALLDLLLLPRPPIGRSAARKLARALSKEPGTGAEAWNAAWVEIEDDLAERFAGSANANAEIEMRRLRWRAWTTGGIYRRADGIPADKARQIAARVSHWAIEIDGGAGDSLLLTVAGAATAFSQAIDVLGQDSLSALLVERMIEQVLADGAQNPDHIATAGGLRCVKNPAAIWGPAARVIWWDFKGPGDRIPSSPWSRSEIAALSAQGCRLEGAAECAARISWSYANAVKMATERLILIRPSLSGDEETVSHPLAHQIDPLTHPAGASIRWHAERLLNGTTHEMAGRAIRRDKLNILSTPQPRARWTLPASAVAKLQGRNESATSLERLVDCQLRWMLLDVLRLPRGRFAEIPSPDQLIGNLAHALANRVLSPGTVADSREILRQVDAIFDDLLTGIAAPLMQPEYAGELSAARVRVPKALAQLADLLRKKSLEVVGTELERTGEFADGLGVRGRLDLIVRHPLRGLGVIDLKWTRSVNRRRDELLKGRAIQLATYSAIADPARGRPVPGAYYLLNQRRLIGSSGALVADEEIDTATSLEKTWDDMTATWKIWRGLAANGSVVATGVLDPDDLMPENLPLSPSEAPCRYCELTRLCRSRAEEI